MIQLRRFSIDYNKLGVDNMSTSLKRVFSTMVIIFALFFNSTIFATEICPSMASTIDTHSPKFAGCYTMLNEKVGDWSIVSITNSGSGNDCSGLHGILGQVGPTETTKGCEYRYVMDAGMQGSCGATVIYKPNK